MKIKYSVFFSLVVMLFPSCENDDMPLSDTISTREIASLNIEYSGEIQGDSKTDVNLSELRANELFIYEGDIKVRGGFSMGFPKKSYSLDLKGDHEFLGLPEDDDWVLNANHIDKTFMRHVVSYELFEDMADNNIASTCAYTEVELNGVYNGLYVAMEKLDKSSLDLDKSDDLAMAFKEPHLFRESYSGIEPEEANNFHQQIYPDIDDVDQNAFMDDLRAFILDSDDQIFSQNLSSWIDVDNFIDWHLLLLISNNSDGILKNFYLYKKDSNTPLRVAPWDYDHSFGRDGDNELNLDERPLDIERSILFKRLLNHDWYMQQLKSRWIDLNNEGLLSVDGLKNRFIGKSQIIRPWALKNSELWPLDGNEYYDDNDFDQEVDIITTFIELRHQRLVDYFDDL